jgi:hypothetical protein
VGQFSAKTFHSLVHIFACYMNTNKLTLKPFSAGGFPIMALDAKKLIFYNNAYTI